MVAGFSALVHQQDAAQGLGVAWASKKIFFFAASLRSPANSVDGNMG
jgi:hypothetical protein